MAVHALEHTLAAFVVDDGKAARRFLEVVQKLDKDDKNVEIVDAAIAERTKRGGVKVHQTKDMGGRKGAVGGGDDRRRRRHDAARARRPARRRRARWHPRRALREVPRHRHRRQAR